MDLRILPAAWRPAPSAVARANFTKGSDRVMANMTTQVSPARYRPMLLRGRLTLQEFLSLLRRVSGIGWIVGAVFTALLGYTFKEPIKWMIERWFLPDSYYSHGVIVPFVVLYLVWRDRRRLVASLSGGYVWGLLAIIAGLFLVLLGGVLKIYFIGAFSMILVLWGILGFLFGWRVLLRLLFPVFVLTFMVALPLEIIEEISFSLKMIATKAAVGLVNLLGIIALNDGSKIYLENGASLTVGAACSGLRSLITFIFLGILFAFISPLSLPRRIILFLSAVPIAILTNILRVFTLCMVAQFWGEESVRGAVHDSSGYMVFILAFFMLYGLEMLLRRYRRRPRPAVAAIAEPQPLPPVPIRGLAGRVAVALTLLILCAGLSWRMLYPTLMEQGVKSSKLPLNIGRWVGYDSVVEDYVKLILETDDVIERNYLDGGSGNAMVQLAVAFSSNNRRVAHPPEICYRAGGWEVVNKKIFQIKGLPPLVRLVMDNGNRRRDVVFYFFKSGDEITSNYYQQQFNIAANQLLGRATASSLVRFSTTIRDNEDQLTAELRVVDFIRLMTPEIKRVLN